MKKILGQFQLLMVLVMLVNALPMVSAQAAPLHANYPPNPTADIAWSAGTSGVTDIQSAFNNAHTVENTQLGTSLPMMTLPSQAAWNAMSDGEKALWLINRERIDRGVMPLQGVEANVTSVAQTYANFLLNNNKWGHTEDGLDPWLRLDANPVIGACHDPLSVSEDLAVSVTSGSSIALPIEKAVYEWMYEDMGSGWGHRQAILWYPYNDNNGTVGSEGFLGIGRASGGPYQGPFSSPWNHAELIVLNVFDPCASFTVPPTTTAIFTDVPLTYWANSYIERMFNDGITSGCSTSPNLIYCPDDLITRAQMAIFLLRGIRGPGFAPPDVGGNTGFTDVALNYWAAAWIKRLAAEGITGGCGAGVYRPDATVTRAQMAVFLLKAKHGSSYSPPTATGIFTDVPVSYWAASWIEQLSVEGVTSGCGAGIYCPDVSVTRAQMAVFLVKAFSLP